jgi:exosome complex component RRP4
VAGVEQNINRLVTVSPLRCRYNGEIGDVVIGRITELVHKRWKVDLNARLDAVLLLTSIQLPGGELVSLVYNFKQYELLVTLFNELM